MRTERKGWEFDLTLEWLEARLEGNCCEITGLSFQPHRDGVHWRNPYGPSLDRKDAKKGYTRENCRVILWALNMGFSDWGETVYREIAQAYLNAPKLQYDL